MEVIERAINHFSAKKPFEIEVPEWADDQGRPLSIWFTPMTVADRDQLLKMQKRLGDGLELVVHVLIRWAKDAQGQPLFTLEHKHALMNQVDPNVLAAITAVFLDEIYPEEVKKKSRRIRVSDSS